MDQKEVEAALLLQNKLHQYRLEQYTKDELVKVYTAMNKVEKEILAGWGKTGLKTEFQQARAFAMLEEAKGMMAGVKVAAADSIAEALGKVSADSATAHSDILTFGGKAAHAYDVALSPDKMAAFWKSTPVGGNLLQDWVNRSFDKDTIERIQQEVAAGYFKGEGYKQVAKRFKEGFGMSRTQIDTLVRTYVQSANVEAMKRVYAKNKDLIKWVRWSAAYDTRTCLVCANLEGKNFPVDDHPPCPVHPRCVHPDTSVFAPDKIAAFITKYDGPVIEFTTADGRKFTVSSNHMLATVNGLTKANLIAEGDYVIDTAVSQGIGLIGPNDDRHPTSIKEQVEAFSKTNGVRTVRVPASPEYLHGDAEFGDGYVDIITFDSLLRGDFKTFISEFIGKNGFIDRESGLFSFPGKSEFLSELWRLSLALGCEVGGFGISPVLFRRTMQHHLSIGFGVTPGVNAMVVKDFPYGVSCNTEAFGNSVFRNTANVRDYNFDCRDDSSFVDPAEFEQGVNKILAPPEQRHDFFGGFAGPTKFTRIKNIRRFHYTGHLYDLHCFCGLYYISGILSSNCRCALVPVTTIAKLGVTKEAAQEWVKKKRMEAGAIDPAVLKDPAFNPDGTLKKTMKSWIFGLPESEQLKFFGPNRLKLIQAGDVDFEDLVNMDTYKVKTLKELQGQVELSVMAKAGSAEALALLTEKAEAAKVKDQLTAGQMQADLDTAQAKKEAEAAQSKKLSDAIKAGMAKKKAIEEAAKMAAEQEALAKLKAEYMEVTIAGKGVSKEVTDAWVFHSTKEEGAALKQALKEKIEAEKAALWASFKDQNTVTTFEKSTITPNQFKTVDQPDLDKPEIWEPEMKTVSGKGKSTGAIVFDEDTGKVFIYEPKDYFGGYEHTFPKGQLEAGLTMQQNAAKEIWEEIGLDVDILDYLGDYEKTTSVSRYYVARFKGGNPTMFQPDETWNVKAVPLHELGKYLNKKVDKQIAQEFADAYDQALLKGGNDPVAGFKALNAEKAQAAKEAAEAAEAAQKAAESAAKSKAIAEGMAKKKALKEAAVADLENVYAGAGPTAEEVAAHLKAKGLTAKESEKAAKAFTEGKATKAEALNGDNLEKYDSQKGSNEGGFYKDKTTGEKYYVKFLKSGDHIDNEILAGKLYQEAGIDVAELSDVTIGGRRALASKVVDGLEKNGAKLSETGSALNNAIKEGMAFDAWLANWDVVGMGYDNLLIQANGKAFHVDVGGSLLFRAQGGAKGAAFGKEVGELKTFLDPKANPYSAEVFKGITKEQIVAGVKKVAAISDERIKEIAKAYAPAGKADEIADILIARKKWLLDEYPEAKGGTAPAKGKVVAGVKAAIPRAITKEFVQDVETLGAQGKALPFDGDYIEDQNALVFVEEFNGQKRTVVKMKTREGRLDERITEEARKRGTVPADTTLSKVTGPQPLKEDKFFNTVLTGTKNAAYHNGNMANINKGKWDAMIALKSELETLMAATFDDGVFDMAKGYFKQIESVEKAVSKGRKPTGQFNQYLADPPAPKKVKAAAPKDGGPIKSVTVGEVKMTMRDTSGGGVKVKADNTPLEEFFRGQGLRGGGVQYEIEFNDGVKARYVPHDKENYYAMRGDLEIVISENASPSSIKKALDKLRTFGVDTEVATKLNAEKMYLEKLAYIRKEHNDTDWRQMLLETEGLPLEEQVEARRKLLSKKLKVADVTKLKNYNPDGEYQIGFLDNGKAGGQRLQYRPDITEEDLDREIPDYVLFHNFTNGGTMASNLKTIMENNGAMISTVEKTRLGIPAGGMSPAQDMGTGGANYFFTRIHDPKSSNTSGYKVTGNTIIFKKKMLLRGDAISYDSDNYGRTTGNFVEQNRYSDIDGFKYCATRGGNETIFKQAVTIMDNVEYFIADGVSDRDETIQMLKKMGITHTADGRKVEDVVITVEKWRKMK